MAADVAPRCSARKRTVEDGGGEPAAGDAPPAAALEAHLQGLAAGLELQAGLVRGALDLHAASPSEAFSTAVQEAADKLGAAVREFRAELSAAAGRHEGPLAAAAADAPPWRRSCPELPSAAAPAPPPGADAGGRAPSCASGGGGPGRASALLGRTGRVSVPGDPGRKSGRLTTVSDQGSRRASEVEEPWRAQTRPLQSTASWDAELAMTVSRTSESEASETRKSRRCIKGTLNPEWTGRLTWDLCVLLLVMCDSVVLPFQLAAFCEESSFDVFWLWSTTFFFLCDLVMNFFTAYPAGKREEHLQEGELVTDKVRITFNYLRGWFWIDFMSTVPWTVIADGLQTGATSEKSSTDSVLKLAKVVKLTRLLRLMRMLRLWKLSVIWERLERQIGSITFLNVVSMLKVLGTWTAICHWGACIWWMFGKRDSLVTAFTMQDDAAAIHWTELERVHSAYDEVGQWRWVDRPVAEQYVFCFYWILGVMRTMPAEVTPVNLTERMFVLLFMFFAVGAFAVNIAKITQAWFRFSARKDAFKEEMACARMHLREIKCGEALQLRAESYFRHLFQKRKIHAKELSLLNVLPEGLKRKLSRAHVIHYLRTVPGLQDWGDPILARVCDATEVMDYLPGDKLTQKDREAEAAYVLTRGFLQIFGAQPAPGARFGSKEVPRRLTVVDEHCLFTSKATLCGETVVALECSEVLRVDRQRFLDLIQELEHRSAGDPDPLLPEVASGVPSYSVRSTISTVSEHQDFCDRRVSAASAGDARLAPGDGAEDCEEDSRLAVATAAIVTSG